MFKPVSCVIVLCDEEKCGVAFGAEDDTGILHFEDNADALSGLDLWDGDWTIDDDGKHFCPEHRPLVEEED